MVFKKTFENKREVKQSILDDLGIAFEDNKLDFQVISTRLNNEIYYEIKDWLKNTDNEVPDLYIMEDSKTVVSIDVKVDNPKCDVAIGLNPQGSNYQNYCSGLQQNGWEQHDVPWEEII